MISATRNSDLPASSTSTENDRSRVIAKDSDDLKTVQVEVDEFGLPVRKREPRRAVSESRSSLVKRTTTATGNTGKSSTSQNVEMQVSSAISARAASVPADVAGSFESSENIKKPATTLASSDQNTSCEESGCSSNSGESGEPVSSHGHEESEVNKVENRPSTNPSGYVASEWSHQRLTETDGVNKKDDDGGWKDMPALGPLDVYDDYGRLVARAAKEEEEIMGYQGLGAAGKGYTRLHDDDEVESVTSLDERTGYLFKEPHSNGIGVEDELRDPLSQLQTTKDLLTEGQRIAYVGVTRLTIFQMVKDLESTPTTKSTKKTYADAVDSMTKWGQQMMIRLYSHMDIDSAEQVMIEQLAEHGVQPSDLVSPLMQNARVNNPISEHPGASVTSNLPSSKDNGDCAQDNAPLASETSSSSPALPPYEAQANDSLPEVRTPSQLPSSAQLDIDLRWTVLCDLFLILIANSMYDARSRCLLEKVGETMDVSWLQICRFEKRVIDALEMQEEEEAKETWNESENMEKRRKMALKKKYMIMGLATVGGGLVIGLSAGLLAPVIGAGLAAGLTTIGISGTGAFLGGVGGTALIASGATITGGTIGIRASHRRTGAVKTFEYRPLHNNKRLNLIVTVSGWMTGGLDDVRLPYSTVDPIMGDLYSVLWEPEMLKSMGATINILATEALTQGLQQVLGNTILTALMASLQLPIVLTKLSYLIDNPWNNSLARANAAGLILADSLMDRNLGNRPITLLGFSLGSRVIFACLKELAKKGAFGFVQNVYLFGSPLVVNHDEYLKARSVVSGRFVNGYATNDWILGYLFRATSGGLKRVAGLAPIEGIPGIENVNVTHLVDGHMAYRAEMPRLLREVGWEIESDEFAELEDPDPDNHQERQRELIREINEARKEAEKKPDKKKFGFFKKGKLAEKKGWETYDVDSKDSSPKNSTDEGDANGNVLFDIDAIRAELASEQIMVKQLESTMPPMKLELNSPSKGESSNDAREAATDSKRSESIAGNAQLSAPEVPSSSGQYSPNDAGDQSTKSADKQAEKAWDSQHYDFWKQKYQEDEIQLTFDTSYNRPSPRQSTEFGTPVSSAPVLDEKGAVDSSSFGAFNNLTHNAWADDDYDEDGIKMTFE
ncbi:hypothetical protein VTO42DRAFT_6854 [Malbranchea cinnamomea]